MMAGYCQNMKEPVHRIKEWYNQCIWLVSSYARLYGCYICPSVHPEQAKARLLASYLHWHNLATLLEHLQKVSLDQTALHLQNVVEALVLVIRLM
jgi:hypothetical protein